jgi:hypothetical protein
MEEHRKNPACASCHRVIDPIGFALENFDPTGAWRNTDNGVKVDASGRLFDGTELNGPADLRNGVLKHKEAFLRAFAENLYAFGLGRIPDYRDLPEIRAIVARAESHGNRFSEYVLGIVESPAFTERSIPATAPAPAQRKAQAPGSTLKADAGTANRLNSLLKPGALAAGGGSR